MQEQEHECTLEGQDIDEVVDELRRLVPGDWTAGSLVCPFKGKGSRSDPAAYRAISLFNSVEKIDVTIKAQVRFLCPLTFKFVTCSQH